jgi:hypothetical protein
VKSFCPVKLVPGCFCLGRPLIRLFSRRISSAGYRGRANSR